jgi:hypothetical protein
MNSQAVAYYQHILKMYTDWRELHEALLINCVTANTELEDLADTAHALKRCQEMTDEIKKSVSHSFELTSKVICAKWAQENTDGEPIRTAHCTCTPRIRFAAVLPKKGDDDYKVLMNHLGINETMVETDAVRPHWPGFTDYVTELLSQGKPTPPGIDPTKTYPVYSVTILKKKGITE